MRTFLRKQIKLFFSNKTVARTGAFFLRKSPMISRENFSRISSYIPIHDPTVEMVLPNKKILKLNHNGSNEVTSSLFWQGSYECETFGLFYEKCQNASVVVDVGANIGYYSALAALANPALKIFSFEPVPALFSMLKDSLLLNHIGDQVEASQVAVADRTGEMPLYIPRDGVLCESSVLSGFRKDVHEVKCSSVSLDDFVEKHKLQNIDLIKVDVEGAEHLVFYGMQKILKTIKPDIICEVLPGRIKKETERLLKESGYRFFWITPKKLVPMENLSGDAEYRFLNYYLSAKEKHA